MFNYEHFFKRNTKNYHVYGKQKFKWESSKFKNNNQKIVFFVFTKITFAQIETGFPGLFQI